MWGRNVGVRAENLTEYPQIAIYPSPKIPNKSYVAFGQKRKKSKMAASEYFEKRRFLNSNPIIKCDMSFLTNFGAWNPFLDLNL